MVGCRAVSLDNLDLPRINQRREVEAYDVYLWLAKLQFARHSSVTAAFEAMAQRFRNSGFAEADIHILGPNERKKNLIVRLHGMGKHKPLLMIGYLDVVEAHREDWTTDPFSFVEKDGFYYGRGTQDMKSGAAIMITTLIPFKKEGYTPNRDIILALTADEEGGRANGIDWLPSSRRIRPAQASIADSESFPTPRAESPYLRPACHRMVRDTCAAETIGTIRNRSETIVATQLPSRSGSSKIPASVFRKTNEAGTERPKRGSDSCRR